MDAADGNQARKNGTGSPMGMLFDHGCDMIALFLILMFTIALYRIEFDMNGLLSLALVFSSFQWNYWKKGQTYFLGGLKLGIINRSNEGILFIIVAHLFVAYTGFKDNNIVIFIGSEYLLAKTSWYPYL